MHNVMLERQPMTAFGKDEKFYKEIGDKVFEEMFKNMQLLAFTVLYYDFGFDSEKLREFNSLLKAENSHCLDDFDNYEKATEEILKKTGFEIKSRVKEFPYRSRVSMSGGIPNNKRVRGLTFFNIFNLQSFSAIDSYMVLSLSQLISHYKWGKTETETFWGNMKRTANETFARGMKSQFVIDYFMDELQLELRD